MYYLKLPTLRPISEERARELLTRLVCQSLAPQVTAGNTKLEELAPLTRQTVEAHVNDYFDDLHALGLEVRLRHNVLIYRPRSN